MQNLSIEHNYGPQLSPFRPRIINAKEAFETGVLRRKGNGLMYEIPEEEVRDLLKRKKVVVSPFQIRSMVPLTMDGLNEALVNTRDGAGLYTQFQEEYRTKYRPSIEVKGNKVRADEYGNWAFYPETCELVQYPPRIWYELALVASNGHLFRDPQDLLTWQQVRERFKNYRVGVAGASVGSEIAVSVLKNMRPSQIDIGDPNVFKTIGLNRTRRTIRDMCFPESWHGKMRSDQKGTPVSARGEKNKAVAFSGYVAWEDPYVNIFTYPDGIVDENRSAFVGRQNMVVEAVDVGLHKERINEECRRQRVRYLLFSDCGSCVLWLCRPYDLNNELPLSCFSSDAELKDRRENAASRVNGFPDYVSALIGPGWEQSGEFASTLKGELETVVKSLPQPSSTVSVAAGIAGDFISRMALGDENIPEAGMINLINFETQIFHKRIGQLR